MPRVLLFVREKLCVQPDGPPPIYVIRKQSINMPCVDKSLARHANREGGAANIRLNERDFTLWIRFTVLFEGKALIDKS